MLQVHVSWCSTTGCLLALQATDCLVFSKKYQNHFNLRLHVSGWNGGVKSMDHCVALQQPNVLIIWTPAFVPVYIHHQSRIQEHTSLSPATLDPCRICPTCSSPVPWSPLWMQKILSPSPRTTTPTSPPPEYIPWLPGLPLNRPVRQFAVALDHRHWYSITTLHRSGQQSLPSR